MIEKSIVSQAGAENHIKYLILHNRMDIKYTFIVDRPCVYVIEDQDTGMILFVGWGNDLVK